MHSALILPGLHLPIVPDLAAPVRRLLRPLGLRIDVDQTPADVDTAGSGIPCFRLHTREADGELYIYVEDIAQRRLAGYTVFNRLIELDRRADRYLRAPHSKYAAGYQRRGLASAVYRRALESGWCLMSGARQSAGAHALWESLARRYPSGYVRVERKRLTYLGARVSGAVLDSLETRRMLLGGGWTVEGLAGVTGMLLGECVP
jgi:hypothetical protein